MHQILETGGEFDESVDSIDRWLAFLTNPKNLRPGLPDLTIYFGDARFCSVAVTFDSMQASLCSLKVELNYLDDEYVLAIFQETDSSASGVVPTDTGSASNPNRLKEWIFGLFLHPTLEALELAFHVPELPDLFHKIPSLRIAHFNYSTFVGLPASFYQLPALKRLSIRNAPIRELPFELGNLHELQYLEFSQPCFAVAWENLTALAELHYYASAITVPGEIMLLKNLKTLCLSDVFQVRDSFLNFPKLEKLSFRVSRTANFRFTTGNLPCLKELDIDDAETFLNALPAFKTLEQLSVSGKINESAIHAFTASLTKFDNLKVISLKGTGIRHLEWCLSMLNLEYLAVENNAITTIPLSLSKLRQLKTVILKKNPLATIPELDPMPQVTFIDLSETEIPIDENAYTDIQPIPEELNKLKRIFPNVEYLSAMTSNT